MKQILLASNNSGKISEISNLLTPIEVIPQKHLNINSPDETGLSFIENALIKARYASMQSGLPTLADDSGLVVPALGGEPGIFSARYAGINASDVDNISLLLKNIQKIPEKDRFAYFYCAIVVVKYPHDPMPLIATGQIEGEIIDHPEGSRGFGYDPIFYLKNYHCTMAQLSSEEKNTISHRGLALKNLKHMLLDFLHEKPRS